MGEQDIHMCVLIADGQPEVRQALRLVCEESLGLIVVAEVVDSSELLTRINATHPDILLLEWGFSGLQTSILIDTLHMDKSLYIIAIGGCPEMRREALEAGANGFVYKGDPPDELLNLLQSFIEKRS
jgi:two-component system, NarL family, invasion response regulator UvrY